LFNSLSVFHRFIRFNCEARLKLSPGLRAISPAPLACLLNFHSSQDELRTLFLKCREITFLMSYAYRSQEYRL
jgi:hypothetical protein